MFFPTTDGNVVENFILNDIILFYYLFCYALDVVDRYVIEVLMKPMLKTWQKLVSSQKFILLVRILTLVPYIEFINRMRNLHALTLKNI